MNTPLLTISNLDHTFAQKRLFQNLSLKIFEGEVVFLVGPSGQGKSTLLKLICGLEKMQSGQVQVARRLCYQPQELGLSGKITALENVLMGYRAQFDSFTAQIKTPAAEIQIYAQKLLNDLGVEIDAQKFTETYSGGEQQRIALARSLMTDAGLFLLDEPFSQLDWDRSCQLMQLVVEQCHLHSKAAFVVVHDHRLIEPYADRVFDLSRGGFT